MNGFGTNLLDAVLTTKWIPYKVHALYKVRRKGNLGRKWLPWVPNLRKVELEITSNCNLRCPNCDRGVTQAFSDESMSLEQIERFVAESKRLNWPWKQVTLIGGEPTLHRDFFKVLDAVGTLRESGAVIAMATNGFGQKVNAILDKCPDWLTVYNSSKESSEQVFSAYNVAPIDIGKFPGGHAIKESDYWKGCNITEHCGMALTRYGYFPCGAGAAMCRVFGKDIGLSRLEDVNKEVLRKMLDEMCRNCGHFLFNDRPPKNVDRTELWQSENEMSPLWKAATENYKTNHPQLTLYPETSAKGE